MAGCDGSSNSRQQLNVEGTYTIETPSAGRVKGQMALNQTESRLGGQGFVNLRDEEGTVIGAADIVEIQGTVTGLSVSMVWTMEGRGTTDVAPEWTVEVSGTSGSPELKGTLTRSDTDQLTVVLTKQGP